LEEGGPLHRQDCRTVWGLNMLACPPELMMNEVILPYKYECMVNDLNTAVEHRSRFYFT
jgi:hypothetical protein